MPPDGSMGGLSRVSQKAYAAYTTADPSSAGHRSKVQDQKSPVNRLAKGDQAQSSEGSPIKSDPGSQSDPGHTSVPNPQGVQHRAPDAEEHNSGKDRASPVGQYTLVCLEVCILTISRAV